MNLTLKNMQNLFEIDEWNIIQKGYTAKKQLQAESIFSIGNGIFGQRANFEEKYSGPSLSGSYVGGIYYPDKTKVGWWKNGYPEYFAKVLNACNWIGIDFWVDNVEVDLNQLKILDFTRTLDMKNGLLKRSNILKFENGNEIKFDFTRFCSMSHKNLGVVHASITPLNFTGKLKIKIQLNGKAFNSDANYDELFWDCKSYSAEKQKGDVCTITRKTEFLHACAMEYSIEDEKGFIDIDPNIISEPFLAENEFELTIEANKTYQIKKYVGITSSLQTNKAQVLNEAKNNAKIARNKGYKEIVEEHKEKWCEIWEDADVVIPGDKKAQQAIRFNIFQLYQTYTGDHEKLNIGPKGFTGEKYGGATYWDTEAYCLPFYLKTADSKIAKQLLLYRYHQLDKAIENAKKLGFNKGAALYPMVTMNGEECHNEWEITFEEIHRNGAIAYAIYNYIEHTGDQGYLKEYGIDVLVAIARFWSQRFNWSENKKAYVILGVTGPNEYENNVNNNWHTNYIAKWCLEYTIQVDKGISSGKIHKDEIEKWTHIVGNTYLPKMEKSNVFLQQDGFLDKEQLSADDIPPRERPINQNWSWDRILRSIFIKQADVLQGIYFFEDDFDNQTIVDNFNFYEPKTVHESSLSPCVHSILACKTNQIDKAYELYLRTSRLDLDDYNHEADEGLHITSMAGTWLSVIEGFAGVKIRKQELHLNPSLPDKWNSLSFNIRVKNNLIHIEIKPQELYIKNTGTTSIVIHHKDSTKTIKAKDQLKITI